MDTYNLSEIFYPAGKLDLSEQDNLIWKTILRTGQWALTPTMAGVQRKPLTVVKEGPSSESDNIVSLSQLLEAFDDNAFEHVTVPLAMKPGESDHADIARNNTGFIRKLRIVEGEDGISRLQAAFDFTEPDIKEKVKRGTIPNTSAGILYGFERKRDGKKYPVALAHAALTHRPWIDGMEPFGIAASDETLGEITSFEPADTKPEEDATWDDAKGYERVKQLVQAALSAKLSLDENFVVKDIAPGMVKIQHKGAGLDWVTAFSIKDDEVQVPPISEWSLREPARVVEEDGPDAEETEQTVNSEESVETVSIEIPVQTTDDLRDAHLLREQRFSENNNNRGGIAMSAGTESLNGLNLSELPEEARVGIQAIIDRNTELERKDKEIAQDAKYTELDTELNLSQYPGFAKIVRRALKSDDGSVAALMLSDDGSSREKKTISDVVEELVKALPKDEEGKLNLSQQIEASGSDERPPATDGETAPLADRTKEAKELLYGTVGE